MPSIGPKTPHPQMHHRMPDSIDDWRFAPKKRRLNRGALRTRRQVQPALETCGFRWNRKASCCSVCQCIAAEPADTWTLAGCEVISTHHKIQGTGYNMVPPRWAPEPCDEYLGVTDEDAVRKTRLLAAREGIFAGFSSGANVWAALQVAKTRARPFVRIPVSSTSQPISSPDRECARCQGRYGAA